MGVNTFWLPNHCLPGVLNRRGRNQKWLHPPLPSRGPKNRRIGYITPAFSGVPNRRGQIQKRITPEFLGADSLVREGGGGAKTGTGGECPARAPRANTPPLANRMAPPAEHCHQPPASAYGRTLAGSPGQGDGAGSRPCALPLPRSSPSSQHASCGCPGARGTWAVAGCMTGGWAAAGCVPCARAAATGGGGGGTPRVCSPPPTVGRRPPRRPWTAEAGTFDN